jgi:arginine exporter protein ArgO
MVTYAQIQRQRPGRITFLAVVCLLFGTPFFVLGLFGLAAMMKHAEARGGIALLFVCLAGGIAIVTGLGLLAMKTVVANRWSDCVCNRYALNSSGPA